MERPGRLELWFFKRAAQPLTYGPPKPEKRLFGLADGQRRQLTIIITFNIVLCVIRATPLPKIGYCRGLSSGCTRAALTFAVIISRVVEAGPEPEMGVASNRGACGFSRGLIDCRLRQLADSSVRTQFACRQVGRNMERPTLRPRQAHAHSNQNP